MEYLTVISKVERYYGTNDQDLYKYLYHLIGMNTDKFINYIKKIDDYEKSKKVARFILENIDITEKQKRKLVNIFISKLK